MEVTDEWLLRWQTAGGGYNQKQLALLGVPWPPKCGWKREVLSKEIPDDVARAFQVLAGHRQEE
ncbi:MULTISPECIES: hypothetical protein [Achromobacter]|uniref:Uncharacterized protein n=2 Tax=Achromobacter piechaudii TaxID=72556 RepID=A0A6S7E499_9BURK|nr:MULTISPECIES: hypothetical protein [Achromobacter]EFF73964.1 hypothetical protein HMPREF0004_4757 [Achromobacter piechaudii ATCC 43553]MPS81320.1 hypothetical protein [Achromobacter sp.]CAB3739385.1 hypothetical protein LMG1873_05597 [Achromobacter piechaudii]CAB3895241.1 hypothetical protein LMG1861_04019 [Achromobacter piechaudii]CAB3919241.1 hypothetical protein LMG2828_05451 [Achromobacter piechaudii]